LAAISKYEQGERPESTTYTTICRQNFSRQLWFRVRYLGSDELSWAVYLANGYSIVERPPRKDLGAA
jgi:hypothetical protein